ncbi:hypothetical protein [Saccharothrix sp. NRRL B-16314]|uniref:hypothetical protein n=1 Tax=Saccharothrix sp. NRRL B-16314 TaxID=1463825 RepID=UPI0012DBEE37|nr:hypothetical protein [Saccharothrix sp. NRRL B-16314]
MVDSTVRPARLAQDGDDIAFSYRREQEVADEVVEEAGAAGRRWTSDEQVRCTRRGRA